MLYNDSITNLLDMEHMEMKNMEILNDRIMIHVEMKRRAATCP